MFKAMAKMMAVAAVLAISTSAMAERRAPSRTPRAVTGVININTATAKQLELLPGVGRKTAQAIVAHRETQPFKSPATIVDVKGIGDVTYLKIKPYITVSGPTTLAVVPKGKADASKKAPEPSAASPSSADGERLAAAQ